MIKIWLVRRGRMGYYGGTSKSAPAVAAEASVGERDAAVQA